MDENGKLLKWLEVPTDSHHGLENVIHKITTSIEEIWDGISRNEVVGIGIGSPGPVNAQDGIVISPPTLSEWHQVPICNIIQDQMSAPVFLEKDVNLAALAEHRFGIGIGSNDMTYITVSTGVGAGLILNGVLYHGGGNAGEIGHMVVDADGELCKCGSIGCLETIASGSAISKASFDHYGEYYNASDLYRMSQKGDQIAALILDRAFSYLSIALVNLINLIHPTMIVIGGGVTQMGDPMFNIIREKVKHRGISPYEFPQIIPASLGRDSGVIGAAVLPFDKMRYKINNEKIFQKT